MKKIHATSMTLLLIAFISLYIVRPAQADINSSAWIKPAWKGMNDPFLGYVAIGYIAGSRWTLNIEIHNDATNSTPGPAGYMEAHVYRIAVWFDWNKFYNTTTDVRIKYDGNYLFTINGTTEQTSVASNMFTHKYKFVVEYEIGYIGSSHTAVTEKKTWVSVGTGFAVLTPDQNDAVQANATYYYFKGKVSGVNDYVESKTLMIQAELEASTAKSYYGQGEFSSALQHYNTAQSLVNQSWVAYKAIKAQYDTNALNGDTADTNLKLAQIDAIKANATARLAEANALATAIVVNSVAFLFFGFGFVFIGLAAIFYARRPKPT
jgi:hypothetical protein